MIYATCYYPWLKIWSPLDSDGHIRNSLWYEFDASDVENEEFEEIMEVFNLDIPEDEYLYYVNVNEEKLGEHANVMFNKYGHSYMQKLRDAVSVYELKKDKKRSKKGIEVYNVIYFVTAGDNSGYVRCEALINNKTDNQEMRIINTSEYLLDL